SSMGWTASSADLARRVPIRRVECTRTPSRTLSGARRRAIPTERPGDWWWRSEGAAWAWCAARWRSAASGRGPAAGGALALPLALASAFVVVLVVEELGVAVFGGVRATGLGQAQADQVAPVLEFDAGDVGPFFENGSDLQQRLLAFLFAGQRGLARFGVVGDGAHYLAEGGELVPPDLVEALLGHGLESFLSLGAGGLRALSGL